MPINLISGTSCCYQLGISKAFMTLVLVLPSCCWTLLIPPAHAQEIELGLLYGLSTMVHNTCFACIRILVQSLAYLAQFKWQKLEIFLIEVLESHCWTSFNAKAKPWVIDSVVGSHLPFFHFLVHIHCNLPCYPKWSSSLKTRIRNCRLKDRNP